MTYLSRRRCGALAAAALGAAALAGPAQAEVIGDSVPANHNVTIFHNIDMIAVFGDAPGVQTTIEVVRGDTRIGHAAGPAIEVGEFPAPNDGGLEANHGPEGAPQPGDCYTTFTPDILPGDVVRVTRGAAVEEVRVDDIEIYGPAFEGLGGDVLLQGHARLADGTPIPIERLDSGEIRQADPRYRANPTRVEATPGTVGGWTAVYEPPYTPFDERDPLTQSERKAALLGNEHAMGYGHVAPPPRETQMSDGLEASGPALGCEGSPGQSNDVTGADDAAINATSGDLVVSGTSMAGGVDDAGALDPDTDITGATITATDGVTSITAAATGDFDGPGDWTATFSRAELDTLADGPVEVSGSWTGEGDPIGGRKMTLDKDVVAPVLTATPGQGTFTGATSVELAAGPGETITYRNDGNPQTDSDAPYTGPIALGFGETVLSVRVRDAAGNVTDETLSYTVNRPPAPPAPPAPDTGGGSTTPPAAPPAPAPIIAPPVQTTLAAPSLNAPALVAAAKARSRVSLRSVRRRGLRAAFTAPSGTRVVVARLFRVKGGKRTLVRRKSLTVSGAGRKAVRFPGRRLRAGRYVVVLRLGATSDTLGPATRMKFVVRR